ncbi:MAG: hypothetical protein PHC30_01045 [Lentisphaeria bacterium]|nr:hypothetical protein [Lentisphaeria bacterium]
MRRHVVMSALAAVAAMLATTGCQSGGAKGGTAALAVPKAPPAVYGQTARPTPPPFIRASGVPPVVDQEEVMPLDDFLDPKRWRPAECTVEVSELTLEGKPALHMHIPVDYHAGEEKYPIGWPRMYLDLRTPEKVFAQYDRFEFNLYATMSREDVPAAALNMGLYAQNQKASYIKIGTEVPLVLGQWTKVSKPISKVESADQLHSLGLNISEKDYRDGDVLHFHFAGIRLVRSSFCRVAAMTAKSAVLFADAGVITVELEVEGPESDGARGVPFELSRDGKPLRLETLPVRRGRQTLDLDVAELRLTPGEYVLTVFPVNPERRVSVPVKVVSSPWEASK